GLFIAPGAGALIRCGALAGTGLICAPSLRLAVPCVMTFSPGARPPVTTQLEPSARSAWIARWTARLPGPTTNTVAFPWGSRLTACWGTRIAEVCTACANAAVTYIPGSRIDCGLGKRARTVTDPVLWSTITSLNSTVPVKPYIDPSGSFKWTCALVGAP